jgi:hypothetical protein
VALADAGSLEPLRTGAVSDSEKWKSAGMVVYNTTSNIAVGLEEGIVEWNGQEWVKPGEETRLANFEIKPITGGDQVTAHGYYNINKVLSPQSNTLSLPVNVITPGLYNVHVTVLEGNSTNSLAGFSFKGSGRFFAAGQQIILLKGEGKPIKSTVEIGNIKNSIKAVLNGASTQTFSNIVQVDGPEAKFSYACSSIVNLTGTIPVSGAIGANDVVLINIVSSEAGGEYIIESDEINGIKLYGRGFLEGNNQTITLNLQSTGTRAAGTFTYTLMNNSTANTVVCTVNIKFG